LFGKGETQGEGFRGDLDFVEGEVSRSGDLKVSVRIGE
jgi:hypothetical protein